MDTEKAFAYAWQEILKSKNLDLPIEHFDQYVGVDDKIVHEKFSSEVNLPSFQETMSLISDIIFKNFGEKTLFNDALECLEYFYHYDWKQACVSDPSRPPFSKYFLEYENNVSFFIGFSISDTENFG